MKTMSKGIDVSYAQGNINWRLVRRSGIEFCIIRTGYHINKADSYFMANVSGAKSAGVKIDGVYHFSYAITAAEARQEAEFAVSLVKKAGLPKSTIIFYDFEYDTVNSAKKRGVTLAPKDCNNFADIFCSKVKELGYQPGIYLNQDYYNHWYSTATLKKYPTLWFAKWSSNKPVVPHKYWQYSATGKIDGISGNVDLNEKIEEVKMEAVNIKSIAMDVIAGKYGNGTVRKKNLEDAGYDYATVQAEVNRILAET